MSNKPLEIIVHGTSTISRRAERGVLTFSVSSTGKSRTQVSEDVTKCSNELQALFASLDLKHPTSGHPTPEAAVTWWSMRSISTRTWIPSHWDSRENRQVTGERQYSANTNFTVKFKDFARLSSIVTTLSSTKFVTVSGIAWQLTDATKDALASENRRKAVKDAVAKATDYAVEITGEGAVPRAFEVTDEAAPSVGMFGSMPQAPGRQMQQGAPGAGDGVVLNVSPENVDLSAGVKVKFVVVNAPDLIHDVARREP